MSETDRPKLLSVEFPLEVGSSRVLLSLEASPTGIRRLSFLPAAGLRTKPSGSAALSRPGSSGNGEARAAGNALLSSASRRDGADALVALTDEAERALASYVRGETREVRLPLDRSEWEKSPAFRRDVWEAIAQIPYGQTSTYAQIAQQVGRPRAARAVGTACRLNPLPLLIPCHRVVPSSGGTGAYVGGADLKRALLLLEGACTAP